MGSSDRQIPRSVAGALLSANAPHLLGVLGVLAVNFFFDPLSNKCVKVQETHFLLENGFLPTPRNLKPSPYRHPH